MAYVPVNADLAGKVAVVTGATAGMGKATACELARMGAETVLACRSAERGEAAVRDIVTATGAEAVSTMQLDLSSLASVRSFAGEFGDRFGRLDVLVNNAAASLRVREVTAEGFERHWQRTSLDRTSSRLSSFRLWRQVETDGLSLSRLAPRAGST
jgi:NAD(P)-dependent dehydrogenase (short-subunit alcohol dehydrogenase family)